MSGGCSVFPFSVNFGTLKCVLRGLSHFCHYKYFSIQLKSSTLTCSSSVMSCLHGGGGYATVWKGIWKPGGNLVAIKKVMQPVEREVSPMISMQKLVETVVSMLCMLEVHRSCIQDSTQQTRYTKYNNTGEDPACSKWNVPMTSNSMELSLIHLVLGAEEVRGKLTDENLELEEDKQDHHWPSEVLGLNSSPQLNISPSDNLWRLHIVHCVIEMVCTAKM